MNSLKIDVIVNDGSPVGVVSADIYGENGRIGVGGAELALLTMCEAWSKIGHRVRLYNSPTHGGLSPFPQYPIDTFIPKEDRDILIIFRSPNFRSYGAEGKKIWWSCDQYTVGSFSKFAETVDEIVTISQFHATHFSNVYGIHNTKIIDLPLRMDDYSDRGKMKIPHRMIFCSVPDRGLHILAEMYPKIKQAIPDASLAITSDYRLWGVDSARNEGYIRKFFGMDGVRFLGAVPRRDMVREQLDAEVMAYPCSYEELFCYAVAECEYAGAYPVTSSVGAVSTTNMGKIVEGDINSREFRETYSNTLIETLLDKDLPERRYELVKKSAARFSLDVILNQWNEVFHG